MNSLIFRLRVSDINIILFSLLISLNFVDDQEIELVHLGMDTQQNPWNPISEDIVISALRIILDPSNYPLAVMCNLGRHRTGIPFNINSHIAKYNTRRCICKEAVNTKIENLGGRNSSFAHLVIINNNFISLELMLINSYRDYYWLSA